MSSGEVITSNKELDTFLTERSHEPSEWSRPQTFDLSRTEDIERLSSAINSGGVTSVYDRLSVIANDLFELRYPEAKDDERARSEYTEEIIGQGREFGTWVLFPWSKELTRYPEQKDLRDLRTSRNRHLITDEEQDRLYDASIAVFGLSVGSNVVDKLVISGIGSTLTIGDMDTLEPSNLNRINATIQDVGSKKVDVAAKKISVADPYIEQVHFRDGVTRQNIDRLTDSAIAPDVIVDEVDDLPAKASLRLFAHEQKIPLIMATDVGDKSILDIERFDTEKTEPFDGKLSSQEVQKLVDNDFTDAERGKFMLKLVGVRNANPRLLRSSMDIGKELGGIPQLGVTASIGGSLAAVAIREILLERELPSGRYIYSPKKIMGLKPQMSRRESLKTFLEFAKNKG